MLRLLVRYRYLTARLLAVAYGHERKGRGLKHVRHELRALHQGGYVVRFNPTRQLVGFANAELVYSASLRGARAVLSDEDYTRQRRQIANRSRSWKTNYEHHLGVSALQLILELGADGFEVARFVAERDGWAAKIPFQRPDGHDGYRYPDATALLRFPSGQQALYLFEIDLTHKSRAAIRQRFLAYQDHLAKHSDKLRTSYRVNNVVVVFVATDFDAVKNLLQLANDVLPRSRRARPLFLFWSAHNWWREETLERRQRRTDTRPRTWTVLVLRNPADILSEASLATLPSPALDGAPASVKPRRLVQPA